MAKLLEPEVHKHTVLSNKKEYVEHLTHSHKPFCGCMEHNYVEKLDTTSNSVVSRYFTFTYVISDTLCLHSDGWQKTWQFSKLVGKHRVQLSSGSYTNPDDSRKTMACNNLHLGPGKISFDWYDNIYKHGAHHMNIYNTYKPIQDQIDTYSQWPSTKPTYTIPNINFKEPFVFASGGMNGNMNGYNIVMFAEQINSEKINYVFEWLPIIQKLQDKIKQINIKDLTPKDIYAQLTLIFSTPEALDLFYKVERVISLNPLELGTTESYADKKYMQSIINKLHRLCYSNLPDEISDDDFIFMEETYKLYRGQTSNVINIHKNMAWGTSWGSDKDEKYYQQIPANNDNLSEITENKELRQKIKQVFGGKKDGVKYAFHYANKLFKANNFEEKDTDAVITELLSSYDMKDRNPDTTDKYHYIVTCGTEAFTTRSLLHLRNFLKSKFSKGYKFVSCETNYSTVTHVLDEIETLILTCGLPNAKAVQQIDPLDSVSNNLTASPISVNKNKTSPTNVIVSPKHTSPPKVVLEEQADTCSLQ